MKFIKLLKKSTSGAAAIEMAILLPFLLLLLFGAFEVGWYIMGSRRVDNAVHDAAFFISREGSLYNPDFSAPRYTPEGEERLERFVTAINTIVLTPFDDTTYGMEMKFVGKPFEEGGTTYDSRVMWSHCIRCTGSNLPGRPGEKYNVRSHTTRTEGEFEVFSDAFGDRARIQSEGQGYILATVSYPYAEVMQGVARVTGVTFANSFFTRVANYPARNRWVDQDDDNIIDINEFYNNMHLCTSCNIKGTFAACGSNIEDAVTDPRNGCRFGYR